MRTIEFEVLLDAHTIAALWFPDIWTESLLLIPTWTDKRDDWKRRKSFRSVESRVKHNAASAKCMRERYVPTKTVHAARECVMCKTTFTPKRKHGQTCSPKCSNKCAYQKRMAKGKV